MSARIRGALAAAAAIVVGALVGLAWAEPARDSGTVAKSEADARRFMIVDCLLPGQVRRLGNQVTYLTPRRPAKLSGEECALRGGEYVEFDRADIHTALKVWLEQAQKGDKEAQTAVGEIYEKGYGGIEANYAEAAAWYGKASSQGYRRAKINLAALYENGLGVGRDPVMAVKLLSEASGLPPKLIALEVPAPDTADRERETQVMKAQVDQLKRDLASSRGALADAQRAAGERERLAQQLEEAQRSGRASDAKTYQSQLDRLDQALRTQKEQVAALEQKLRAKDEEVKIARANLGELQQQLGQVQAQLDGATKAAAERGGQGAVARKEAEQLKAQLQDAQARLADLDARAAAQRQAADAARARAEDIQKQSSQNQKALDAARADQAKAEDAARARAEEMQRQSSQSQKALDAARADQAKAEDAARARAEEMQKQISQNQKALDAARADQAKAEDAARAREKELNGQRAEVARLDKLSRDREDELRHQRDEVDRLAREKKLLEERIALMEKEKQQSRVAAAAQSVPLAPPNIELLDPSILATRAATTVIQVDRELKVREIVGRVTAPAGLMSFTVNDRPHTESIDATGLFKAVIPLGSERVPVRMLAIDRQGKQARLEFTLAQPTPEKPKEKMLSKSLQLLPSGPQYALVIGNGHYQSLPSLDTAEEDAKEVADLLQKRYGFKTTLLLNATRYVLLTELNKLRQKLTEKDNLLIYYAGHGELDRVNLRAHWLPVDAEPTSDANWISNVAITDILNAMTAKHVLIVADSCYSGAMTRGALGRLESGMSEEERVKWLKALDDARSRTVMTSGGVQPVLDGGGGKHSLFAKWFIEVLRQNQDVIEGQRLFQAVAERVVYEIVTKFPGITQKPEYAPLKFAGQEMGDFLFRPSPAN